MQTQRNAIFFFLLCVSAVAVGATPAYSRSAPVRSPHSAAAASGVIRIPQDEATIQLGIDAAADGETVLVAAGTYRENIDFHGKNIVLASKAGAAKTVIDGGQVASVVVFRSGETRSAVLDGFTITMGLTQEFRYPFGAGVSIRDSSPRIANCVITKNGSAAFGGGVSVAGSTAAPLIENNTISNNIATERAGGMEIREGACPVVKGNIISDNLSMDGAGIEIINRASPLVEGNTISDNVGGYDFDSDDATRFLNGVDVTIGHGQDLAIPGGVLINYHSAPTIKNNTIAGNSGGGIGVFLSSAPRIENNSISRNSGSIAGGVLVNLNSTPVIKQNSIRDNLGPAIWRDKTSSYTLTGNQVSGPLISWPAKAPKLKRLPPGRVLPVPRKYGTIQGAIRAAANGDTVVVAPGLYKENLDLQGKRITVRSQDPQSASVVGSTIIEGNGPAPTVAFTRGEPKDAALKGFTIRNSSGGSGIHVSCSSPTIVRNVISGLQGSGIQISPPEPQGQATAPLIMANTISDNLGGIVMRWASPVLSDNVITRNRQGGIEMWWSHAVVRDNRIEENIRKGIYVDHYSQPVIKGNLVSGNTDSVIGAGIYLDDSCNAVVDGNMITGNVSKMGAAGLSMILDCYPQVTNNVFAYNSQGAMYVSCSQPQVINNTFVGNAINVADAAKVTITNSILFDSDVFLFDDCSEWVMTYSIDNRFQREGEGNLFCDPLFAGENDYHLLATSPAIDAGTAVDLQTDIEGTRRPQGSGYDIGAYEYVSGR